MAAETQAKRSEKLSEELGRLVREYDRAWLEGHTSAEETFDRIAKFTIENSDALIQALRNKGE